MGNKVMISHSIRHGYYDNALPYTNVLNPITRSHKAHAMLTHARTHHQEKTDISCIKICYTFGIFNL